MKHSLAPIILPVLLLGSSLAAAGEEAPFELVDGDRVVLVGNTFIERELRDGYIETMLTSRFPGRRITFRNLGWSGDTVSVQMRPLNFGTLEEHVARQKPTVLFACYGMNEAYQGESGLAGFVADYAKLLDKLAATGARIVLLSPIAHEDLGPPLPDPSEHNRNLALYVDATRKLAAERGYRFVDLFHGLRDGQGDTSEPLTENGIHLSPAGYQQAAEAIARQLGLSSSPYDRRLEKLRETIVEKNRLFFYRWRAHNGEYIYGRRSTTSEGYKDGRGNAGNPTFPGEMRQLEGLIAEKEAQIAKLAVPASHTYELIRDDEQNKP